jgi:hypothetical protein
MANDRYPSLESLIIQTWINRLEYLFSLPFKVIFDFINLVRRDYNETANLIFFYLAKGTVYDIESDIEQ